jgi:cystathionine beta-lyase
VGSVADHLTKGTDVEDNARRRLGRDTRLVHCGGHPRDRHGAVNPPVYRASTILFPTVAEWEAAREPERRFDVVRYGQLGTPTTFALEEAIAMLEGGSRAMLVPSGLAAAAVALQALLGQGDHLLMVDTTYSPTRHFCDAVLSRFGVSTTYYDPLVGAGIAELLRPNTKVVFLESPGSLTFEVQDVPAIAAAAHRAGVTVVLDNSWATPYYFPALDRGVDVSINAATKYVGGHSDVMIGTIATTDRYYLPIRSFLADSGLCVSPDDAYLALRGMRTLGLRLERHQRNALRVAGWLADRPEVSRVLYPALPTDPGHSTWRRDFLGASGLLGVVLAPTSRESVTRMLDGLELFGMGASFGGFESLAILVYPERHRTATAWDPTKPCLRLHVGLEDPDDLIEDLSRGFDRLSERR